MKAIFRSIRLQMFFKIGILKNPLLNKVAVIQTCNVINIRLQNCIEKLLTVFFTERLRWLLLYIWGTCSLPHFTCFYRTFLMFSRDIERDQWH